MLLSSIAVRRPLAVVRLGVAIAATFATVSPRCMPLLAQAADSTALTVAQGTLAVGRTATRDLRPPALHEWRLSLDIGEYIEVEVVQRGVDLAVLVGSSAEKNRFTFDRVRAGELTERARWTADANGSWTVRLSPAPGTKPGRYEIRWSVRRSPTPADRELLLSDSLRREAVKLSDRSQYAPAMTLMLRVLEIRERLLDPHDLDVVLAVQDLAVLTYRLGRYADAERHTRRLVGAREQLFGTDHPEVATALNILATIQLELGRYAVAESLSIRVLGIRERTFGPRHVEVAGSLNNLAVVYVDQGRYAEAESLYRRALDIREVAQGPEHPEVARILANLARLSDEQGRYAEAEPLHRRTLAIREKAHGADHDMVGLTLYLLGWNTYRRAQYAEAESLTRRALVIREKTVGPEHPFVGSIHQNLAIILEDQGRFSEAEPLHRRALAITEKAFGPDHPDVARNLNDLAGLYYRQSRYSEAEAMYRRAFVIRERALGPDHHHVGVSLNNLALTYTAQGRYAEAEPLYRRGLAISEKAVGADHPSLGGALSNIAYLYVNQHRFAEAEPVVRRALAIREKSLGMEHPDLVPTLFTLADLLMGVHRYAEAETVLLRVRAVKEKAFGVGHPSAETSLWLLAALYFRQGRYAEAEALQRRVLAAEERLGHPDRRQNVTSLRRLAETIWARDSNAATARPLVDRAIAILEEGPASADARVRAYTLRARIRKGTRDADGAVADLAEAIQAAEEMRPQIGGGEEARASFFDRFTEQFDLMVDWQLEAGAVERALEYAERGRARVLLDQLAAGKIDLRESIVADERAPLEARETAARARLAEYQQRLATLPARNDLPSSERARLTELLEDSLRTADRDFRAVYEEIRNASPLWRDLITSGGQPVSLSTMQRRVVPRGGFLLLYQIGAANSFLFVVPATGSAHVLPLRVADADARALGVPAGPLRASALDEILRTLTGSASADSAGGVTAGFWSPRGMGLEPEQVSIARLHALWRVLVPTDAWRRVRESGEIVIVPGRGLHTLPFEALVVSPGATPSAARYWIDDGPAIRYGASATTIHSVEQRPAARAIPAAEQAAVLSLSDPIFDPRDVQADVRGDSIGARSVDTASALLARNAFLAGGGTLARLPGTAAETEAITQAFGRAGSSPVMTLQRSRATETALRPALAGKRYLHLATHGLVDERRGALFAALALTPPGQATAEDDGFFQLHEIYGLRLPELELAVLSACETNLGTTIGGEGVFALSRGFLAAGARRVVASQWAVEDASTARLMGHFFQAIAAAERAGRQVDYVIALRDAKRAVRQEARWTHPYFWAPFVLTGAR